MGTFFLFADKIVNSEVLQLFLPKQDHEDL